MKRKICSDSEGAKGERGWTVCVCGGEEGEDWPEMVDVTVARAPNDMLVIERVFKCLGRYVTVLRKRTRQCKAPNGVLDNTEFASRPRVRLTRLLCST